MVLDKDYPEFFLCVSCRRYRPMEELVEIQVRDFLFPKNMCQDCVKNANKKEVLGGTNAGTTEVPQEKNSEK